MPLLDVRLLEKMLTDLANGKPVTHDRVIYHRNAARDWLRRQREARAKLDATFGSADADRAKGR